ncbi:MAG: rRNA maturation RNase YbeY [Myxococcota bacterium]|nr:rRNA maturation RNase YbeY [Myxococcota bacterium]
MSVSLVSSPAELDHGRLDLRLFKQRARAVLRLLGHAKSELSIGLVDDAGIRELNRDHRGRDRATDVLSFSLVEGDHALFRGNLLGDVVISLDTAKRQARERHRSLDQEAARLLIHGVLHLIGHDHEDDEGHRRMRAEERRLSAVLRH